MKARVGVIVGLFVASTGIALAQTPRSDANFALAGATTNTLNGAAVFAPALTNAVRASGLDLFGLSQELEFARAALADVDSERDVFWLWAGTNNILVGIETGAYDPMVAPAELGTALEQLYDENGARVFVVPNLMLLGNVPRFNGDPAHQSAANELTAAQNDFLAGVLAHFVATHPDVTMIPLDVEAQFLAFESDSDFDNTTEACFAVGFSNGVPCDGFLYVDDTHFGSTAAGKIAVAAADALSGIDVRRIVTLGDSLSDTGNFFDTTSRALGSGLPPPPYFEGRLTEGLNVIDQLELMLDVDVPTTFFPQPFRVTLSEGRNSLGELRSVLVPNRIALTGVSRWEPVLMALSNNVICLFLPDHEVDNVSTLTACLGGAKAGQRISTDDVAVFAPWSGGNVTFDLFYY